MKFFDKSLLSIDSEKGRMSVFGLALPLFVESVSANVIGLIQTAMSSRYEHGYFVSLMAKVNSALSFYTLILSFVGTGMAIILSINLGRKRFEDCKEIFGTAMIATGVLAVVGCIVFILLRVPLMSFYKLKAADDIEAFTYGERYFIAHAITLIISYISNVITSCLRVYGYTKVGFYTTLVGSIIATFLTYLFLYVIVVPRETAIYYYIIASTAGTICGLILRIIYAKNKKVKIKLKVNWNWLGKITKVGFPASVANAAYTLSNIITSIIIASLTNDSYDTKIYVTQIVFFVYSLGQSIGSANSIMVGRVCGQGNLDKADKMHRQNLRITLLCNISLSLLLAFFSRPIMTLVYGANEQILQYASIVLFIDVLVETGRGMNHIGQNGLNATGDTIFTTIVSIVACWAISVGLSALFVLVFHWDIYGVWIAFAIDELTRGTLYYIRWKKGRWRSRFNHELEIMDKQAKTE